MYKGPYDAALALIEERTKLLELANRRLVSAERTRQGWIFRDDTGTILTRQQDFEIGLKEWQSLYQRRSISRPPHAGRVPGGVGVGGKTTRTQKNHHAT